MLAIDKLRYLELALQVHTAPQQQNPFTAKDVVATARVLQRYVGTKAPRLAVTYSQGAVNGSNSTCIGAANYAGNVQGSRP